MWKTKLWIRIESLFITELSVVAKTEETIFHVSFDGNKTGTEAEKGQSKNILQIQKNIQNRYHLEKSLLKSLSNRQNKFQSVTFHSFTEL